MSDIDYRVRCVVLTETHQRIFYGMRAKESPYPERAVDVMDKFDHSGDRGRRSGRPRELEKSRHYFNRRIE